MRTKKIVWIWSGVLKNFIGRGKIVKIIGKSKRGELIFSELKKGV